MNVKVIFRLLAALLFTGVFAVACECGPPPPMCQRYERVKVAFLGTPVETNENYDGYIKGNTWYKFTIQEIFKGIPQGTKELLVDPGSGTSCQTEYRLGEQYLVTTYGGDLLGDSSAISVIDRGLNSAQGRPNLPMIYAPECTGTKPSKDAKDDIAFLRGPPDGPARIYGIVRSFPMQRGWYEEYPGLPRAAVMFRSASAQFKAETDKNGNFELRNVPPGEYTVELQKPGHSIPRDQSKRVNVPPHGCGVLDAGLKSSAAISGRVLDSRGRYVSGICVEAIFFDSRFRATRLPQATTSKDGRFTVKGLPAGEYLLGIHLDSLPSVVDRIPPTYWPTGNSAAQAKVLHLKPGDDVQAVTIRLGEPAPLRHLNVHIRTADGRPIKPTGLQVSAGGGLHPEELDIDGSDKVVSVLAGVSYEFRAWFFESQRGRPSVFLDGRESVPPGRGDADLNIVVRSGR